MNALELYRMGDSLEKVSGFGSSVAAAGRKAGRLYTKSGLHGAGIGSAVGATSGAISGATGEDGSVSKAIGGALAGGALGAVAGGASGGIGRAARDYKLLNPGASNLRSVGGAFQRVGGGIKNFGKRQVHGLTGAYKKDPGSMRLRSSATSDIKRNLANLRTKDELAHTGSGSARKKILDKHRAASRSLREEGELGDRLIDAGVTSIPGTVKGLVTSPVKTTKALVEGQIGSIKNKTKRDIAKAAVVPAALTGVMYGGELAKGDESAKGGFTLGQKLVRAGAGTTGMVATGGMPIIASGLGYTAIEGGLQRLTGTDKTPAERAAAASAKMTAKAATPPSQALR